MRRLTAPRIGKGAEHDAQPGLNGHAGDMKTVQERSEQHAVPPKGFAGRSRQRERMDLESFSRRDVLDTFRIVRRVNRFLGGAAVVRRFLQEQSRRTPRGRVLRLLDVGAGDGEMAVTFQRWAARHGIELDITCVEQNPHAAKLARARIASAFADGIRVEEEDIFSYQPAQWFDVSILSMVCHHFDDERLPHLLQHVWSMTARSLLVNDLRRSRLAYLLASMLFLPAPRVVRHDALLSIRKGFRALELQELLAAVGPAEIATGNRPFFRVEGVVKREGTQR